MERQNSVRAINYALIVSAVFFVFSLTFIQDVQALTASYGRPYGGHLENGVPFPTQFPGYKLREESRTYTTPEVIGALLDAIEAVRTEFPDTCDVYLGDFSSTNGGSAIHHRSHQNGRDVDVGMYAKGNRPLDQLVSMNESNLDAAKTWCLIENIIRSQRVQYIFLDKSVQRILYDYAVSRGYEQAYLDRIFGNVRGSLIQHVRNHVDHFHVRFFTPWSTLAAHIDPDEAEKRMVIDMAQQSYLPKRVNYYVNGSEKSVDELAKSFGVTKKDLCKWNQISPSGVPVPGSCLVFYKRSFESEPVHLARSLQPGFIAEAPTVRMASLRTEASTRTLSDSSAAPARESASEPAETPKKVEKEKHSTPTVTADTGPKTYVAKRGDTLDKIARRSNIDVKILCQLNGISKTTPLRPGRIVKTPTSRMLADSGQIATDASSRKGSPSAICFTSDPKKPGSPTAAYYTVNNGGSLQDVSRKTGISLSSLCQLNGLSRNAKLKPGQRIKLTQADLPVKPSLGNASCSPKEMSKKAPAAAKSAPQKAAKPSEAKAVKKGAEKSAAVKSKTQEVSKSAAAKNAKPAAVSGKAAQKQAVSAKEAAKGKPAAVDKKASGSKSAETKPAQKNTGKTAAKPAKDTKLASAKK